MSQYKLNAKWTNDCCGKKDYDGRILVISPRYWPRGGGYFTTTVTPGQPVKLEGDDARPEVKPSATCSLCLVSKDPDCDSEELTAIVEKDFEGETFEEVAQQVEAWAQDTMDRAVRVLSTEFQVPKSPEE